MAIQKSHPAKQFPSLESAILEAVRSIHYGSVEIVIHDSTVVQIERREKVRFERQTANPPNKGAST